MLLSGTQSVFATALLDRQAPSPDLRFAGKTGAHDRRFSIYRNNVFTSLATVLTARFPAVTGIVGEEFFRGMAAEFVAAHPPSSPVMLEYGALFPAFVSRFPPARDIPYLASVAEFEWLRHEASHAADTRSLSLDALAGVDPERVGDIQMTLHPAARLFASRFPAVTLWRINTADLAAPEEIGGAEAALIARPDLSVHIHGLAPGAFSFLSSIARGEPLSAAVSAGQSAQSDFDLAATLATAFSAGAISGVSIP